MKSLHLDFYIFFILADLGFCSFEISQFELSHEHTGILRTVGTRCLTKNVKKQEKLLFVLSENSFAFSISELPAPCYPTEVLESL